MSGGINLGEHTLSTALPLFIMQILVIVGLARLMGTVFRYFNQPTVVAEMITGIVLGPTVLGNIPGFTSALFAPAKMPPINMCSQLAIIFYMFLVGLEMDLGEVRRSGVKAFVVVFSGLAMGMVLAVPLAFILDDGSFYSGNMGVFIFYYGIVMGISALPVMARILSERGMIKTPFGMFIMSCVIADDIVAWPLVAVASSLAGTGSGGDPLDTLYTIPVLVGDAIVLWFIVRPIIQWATRKLHGDEVPPWYMFTVLFVLLAFCFCTETTGLTSVLGALQVGLILPRDNPHLAEHLTEKLQDITVVVLLPLFFAASGLKTNLLLLTDGTAWGLTVLVYLAAMLTMVLGAGGSCWAMGMPKRDSLAIGVLMTTKGLVALIALNIGIDTHIISAKMFAMSTIMVVVTTAGVIPIVNCIMPKLGAQTPKPIVLEETGGKTVVLCMQDLTGSLALVSTCRYILGKSDALLGLRLVAISERPSDFMHLHAEDTIAQVCADRATLLGFKLNLHTIAGIDPVPETVRQAVEQHPALVLVNYTTSDHSTLMHDLLAHHELPVGALLSRHVEAAAKEVVVGISGSALVFDVVQWLAATGMTVHVLPLDESRDTLAQIDDIRESGLGVPAMPLPDEKPVDAAIRLSANMSMLVIPANRRDADPSTRSAKITQILNGCTTSVLLVFRPKSQYGDNSSHDGSSARRPSFDMSRRWSNADAMMPTEAIIAQHPISDELLAEAMAVVAPAHLLTPVVEDSASGVQSPDTSTVDGAPQPLVSPSASAEPTPLPTPMSTEDVTVQINAAPSSSAAHL